MAWLKHKPPSASPGKLASPSGPASRGGTAFTRESASAGMPANCVPADLPVHRPEIIAQLAEELETLADALRYRDNFARLLPQRVVDLDANLRSKNPEDAEGTLLSLHVGSTMVGAPRLQYVVDHCLSDFRNGHAMSYLPALAGEAERFLTCLAQEQDDAGLDPRGAPPNVLGEAS